MAFLNDYVLDAALSKLDVEADRLDICTTEPTTYTEATSTLSKGNKTGLVVDPPSDRTPDGREVIVQAFTDGSVTGNGTVNFWSLVDTGNNRLLATGPLDAPQVVTAGNPFSIAEFAIGLPDAEVG